MCSVKQGLSDRRPCCTLLKTFQGQETQIITSCFAGETWSSEPRGNFSMNEPQFHHISVNLYISMGGYHFKKPPDLQLSTVTRGKTGQPNVRQPDASTHASSKQTFQRSRLGTPARSCTQPQIYCLKSAQMRINESGSEGEGERAKAVNRKMIHDEGNEAVG